MDAIKLLLSYSLILLISLFTTTSITYAQSGNHGITLIYTGNLDGELEPCGCSEGGNKGGIKRQVKKIDELRAEEPNLFLISSGGLLISEMPQDKLKSEYILKGLAATNYDAIGIQWKDLAFGKAFLNKHKLPFVISNSSNSDFLHSQLVKKKNSTLAFFSWLDTSGSSMASMHDKLVNGDTEKLKTELTKAKKQSRLTVLSTTYTLKQAQKKLPLDDVDILIIRAKYELYGEPQKTGKTLVIQPGSRGMRLGKLSLQVNKSGNIDAWRHEVIALPPEVDDSPRMADWYDEYNTKVKEQYEKSVAIRKAMESGESPFAGEQTCANCHKKAYETWSGTRHAEAFYSLQDAGKAFDPNCIGCHTVGFNQQGGFIDSVISENLMHVQCENCHGAGKAHADSAGHKPVANKDWSAEQICGQCHVQKHSPDFNFETYWPKIKHGK